MSRITQKSAVAPLNPWVNISTGVPNQAFSAIPDNGAQPSSATGFYYPGFQSYVGQKFDTSDGRELVLVRNGAAAAVPGKVYQSPAQITGFFGLAMTVPTAYPATAGLFQVLVTNGSTVLKVNQFAGGYLITQSATGAGQMLKIASHQPAANAATFVVTLEDPIQTTLDATTTITLQANPYDGVILNLHTSQSAGPVAVSLYNIAASTAATYDGTKGTLTTNGVAQYGIMQTHGPVACLIDATTTVGYPLGSSANVDGALEVATLTTSAQCAISLQTQVDTKYGLVYLQL